MKLHEIRFVNYYTTAEVESFAELRDLRDAQELRIHIPLEDKRLAYFEVQRIEHPNWAFKSTCLQFTGWEDEVEFFREKALQFVQAHVQALVENAVVELSLPPQVSSGKQSLEREQLFLQLSRPFMYPFTQLDSFLKRLGRFHGRNREMEFIMAWRSNNVNGLRYEAESILQVFIENNNVDLNTMPELIPAMYLFMDATDEGGLPARVWTKIRDTHAPDDSKRARIEAVQAVWDRRWDDYLAWYAKIPQPLHDWDPVPRYFIPTAIHERVEDWDAMLEAYNEITYYGGIPLYLLYSIKGCWEFERGDLQAALASKLEAYRSGVSQEFIAIQIAVIYNKLGMHDKVIPLFTAQMLDAVYSAHEEKDLDAAMTQICIALKELDDKTISRNFETMLSQDVYFEKVIYAYQKAAAAHFTEIKEQTPVKRALEGCMGG